MAFGKRNIPKTDIFSYNLGLLGEAGVGKTTIIKEMCEKKLGENGYLFIECGKEDGADAINGINYINCPSWNEEYDEINNSVGFINVIDDIIENKEEEYPNLRVVVIDTYDQLRNIAEPEIIRLHNKEHSDKRVKSIKAAFGGYMAGEDMADDLILDKLWELKKVGVNFIIIGHIKQREIVDAITGDAYTQLTTDMSMRSFNKIKTKLHFLGLAYIDREIVQEKKNKKEVGVVKNETRKITFRDDSYALDSKSRFADIVDEIPFDVDELISALEDAIMAEVQKNGTKIEDVKKNEEKQKKIADKKAKEYSKKAKENKIDEETNSDLIEQIRENFAKLDKEQEKEFKVLMKEKGVKNFKPEVAEDIPTKALKELLAFFD